MSRALAWRHRGGGAHGHVFVWPAMGSGGTPPVALSTVRHSWLLYGRKGGAHGQLFVWDRALGSAGAVTPPAAPTSGRKLISQALAATIHGELT